MNKCKCPMRDKLAGDGCAICNPERAADLSEDREINKFDTAYTVISELRRFVAARIKKVTYEIDNASSDSYLAALGGQLSELDLMREKLEDMS